MRQMQVNYGYDITKWSYMDIDTPGPACVNIPLSIKPSIFSYLPNNMTIELAYVNYKFKTACRLYECMRSTLFTIDYIDMRAKI